MTRGVKIVQPLEGGKYLASYRVHGSCPAARAECDAGGVLYTPGTPVLPPPGWGPLAVFPDLETARRFLFDDYFVEDAEVEVWSCDYEEMVVDRRLLWNGVGKSDVIPPSTVFASSVTLRERLGTYWNRQWVKEGETIC